MIKIRFSQCGFLKQDAFSQDCSQMPVYVRSTEYACHLLEVSDQELTTYDELLILIAQYLVRKKVLKKEDITLVSICHCSGEKKELTINLDDEGDMLGDPHHGFFTYRLQYLR